MNVAPFIASEASSATTRRASSGAAAPRTAESSAASSARSRSASARAASACSIAPSAFSSRCSSRPAAFGVFENGPHGASVLSLEPLDRVQPLLHDLESLGIRVERGEIAPQLAAEVLRLDPQGTEASYQLVEIGIGSCDRVGHALGLRQQHRHARCLGVIRSDGLAAGPGDGTQAVDLAQPLALRGQRLLLFLGGRERLDLLQLEPQQVEIAVAGAGRVAEGVKLAGARLARARGRRPSGRAARGGPARRSRRAARAGPMPP